MARRKSLAASTKASLTGIALLILLSTKANAFQWPFPSFRGTGGEISGSRSEQSSRHLTDADNGSITLDSVNSDGTVTVTLRQVEFGVSPDDCGDNSQNGNTAQHFFAVYASSETGQAECDYSSNVDACFTKNIVVACDANTNVATVELFIRDETWSPHDDKITNPMVGGCLTQWPVLGKSRGWTASFSCLIDPPPPVDGPDTGVPPGEDCVSDEDCQEGHFCSTESFTCQAYEPEGGSCGSGMFAPGFIPQCDPLTMYCQDNPFTCTGLTDAPGSCKYFGGTCTTDTDCDATEYYCDELDGLCKEFFQMGDCCDDVTAPCAPPMACMEVDMFGTVAYVCQ